MFVQGGDDLELRNFEGAAHVGRTPQGLLLQAKFSAETTLECVRCLFEFDHAFVWEMTELYEQAGFQLEVRMRDFCYRGGSHWDQLNYGCLLADWQHKQAEVAQ